MWYWITAANVTRTITWGLTLNCHNWKYFILHTLQHPVSIFYNSSYQSVRMRWLRTFKLNRSVSVNVFSIRTVSPGRETRIVTMPGKHRLAKGGQSQLCAVCPEPLHPALPNTIMSSLLDGSCTHKTHMTLLAAAKGVEKKKQNWYMITNNVSVCFRVGYVHFSCNMWLIK